MVLVILRLVLYLPWSFVVNVVTSLKGFPGFFLRSCTATPATHDEEVEATTPDSFTFRPLATSDFDALSMIVLAAWVADGTGTASRRNAATESSFSAEVKTAPPPGCTATPTPPFSPSTPLTPSLSCSTKLSAPLVLSRVNAATESSRTLAV